jgi:hypothetical protein
MKSSFYLCENSEVAAVVSQAAKQGNVTSGGARGRALLGLGASGSHACSARGVGRISRRCRRRGSQICFDRAPGERMNGDLE